MDRPIGVFDSGIGGLTVLKHLMNELPNEKFIYLADSKNAPYGQLPINDVIRYSVNNTSFLLDKNCKLIVVACNTATAAAIESLRSIFNVPFVGLEPAIKPACLKTKTNNIGVLATKNTLSGNHFINTSHKYKDYINIHVQIANKLVHFAEKGVFSGNTVKDAIKEYLGFFKNKNIDYLVLGCTHYPFFIEIIRHYLDNNINIIDSAEAVTRRTKDLLMVNKMLRNIELGIKKQNHLYSTSQSDIFEKVVEKYLNSFNENLLVEKDIFINENQKNN